MHKNDKRWEDDAACKDVPELDWYTVDKLEQYQCRAVCQSVCPVRKECLSAALSEMQIWGIWGGVDDYEIRRALSVDALGKPTVRVRLPRCPFCLSRDLTIAGSKTKHGYLTHCNECSLTWNIATIPTSLKTKKRASS